MAREENWRAQGKPLRTEYRDHQTQPTKKKNLCALPPPPHKLYSSHYHDDNIKEKKISVKFNAVP